MVPLMLGPETDHERALLSVLRLLDRCLGHLVLSPVDRAFVYGAKSTFEQLATECDALLKRKSSGQARRPTSPSEPPKFAPEATARDVAKTKPGAHSGRKAKQVKQKDKSKSPDGPAAEQEAEGLL
jgi:hypothetical protein